MKWIGQNIYDLISRFRNDVYLEDISTGTIASGGNLGLDSNNKIVKATVSSGSGDITAVTITTDSGGGSAASDTDGSADFSILGSAGVGVTNSGTTITARAEPSEIDHDSLQNFDANEHFTQANITTVGTISTGVWQGTAIASAYLDSDTAHLSGTQTFSGAKSFSSSATFQDNVFFENAEANKPYVQFTNTNSGATSSLLYFIKDKGAAGAEGDDIATFVFRADNSAQEITSFSQIVAEVSTATDTDEAGKLSFQIAASDGSTSNLRDTIVLTGSGANDIVDVSVGYGATSTTTVNGILNVSGASSTFDCDTVTFQSDNADDPKIVIQNNTNDAQGARLQMKKNRGAAQVNNDNVAEVDFFGEDGSQNQAQYAKLLVKANEVTDGQESGDLRLQVAAHDASLTQGFKLVGGSESGEVDVTIAAGANSLTSVEGSLQTGGSIELGHASDTTIARSASGVATIESNIVQTRNKAIYIETSNFSDDIGTDAHYIPFVTTSENTNFANVAVPMLAPVNGKLLGVHFKANVHTDTTSNTVTFRLAKVADGDLWSASNATVIGTKVIDGVNRVNTGFADFTDLTTSGASGTNAFSATELIGVSMQNSVDLASTKYSVTLVFEFDFNSYG